MQEDVDLTLRNTQFQTRTFTLFSSNMTIHTSYAPKHHVVWHFWWIQIGLPVFRWPLKEQESVVIQ